jgi:DNA segregation ATPase FtsK/SpoIIIE-like protein
MRNSEKVLFKKAKRIVIENNNASISFLQRKLIVGYNKAAKIMLEFERKGIVLKINLDEARRIVCVKRFKREKKFKSKHKNQKSKLIKF